MLGPMDGSAATGAAESAYRSLNQLRRTLSRFSFDELRQHAAEQLTGLLPGIQLQLLPLQLPSQSLERGYQQLPGHGLCYLERYVGPPEPLQLIASELPDSEAELALLELVLQELLLALQRAGYRQELDWLARRDWLTGLAGRHALERTITAAQGSQQVLALLELPAESDTSEEAAALRRRRFGRALRSELLEGEQAFTLEGNRFALLVKEGRQQRQQEFLNWRAPGARLAWAALAEAPGAEVLRLADARLRGQGSPAAVPNPEAGPTPTSQPLQVLAGSPIMQQLARSQLADWRFPQRLNLIIDVPAGFALEVLPATPGRSLIVTGSRSQGYLLDLQALNPQGLITEPDSLTGLRAQLQRLADGEQVYAGPLLKDDLLPRERQVWNLTARGLDNDAIGAQLGVSAKTVANYLSALQHKLGLESHTDLVLAYWAGP